MSEFNDEVEDYLRAIRKYGDAKDLEDLFEMIGNPHDAKKFKESLHELVEREKFRKKVRESGFGILKIVTAVGAAIIAGNTIINIILSVLKG